MGVEKNIIMKQFNGTDYDTLYPKTIAEQVEGIYSKEDVLSNDTKVLYGLTDSAVPNDVFNDIKLRFDMVASNKAGVTVNIKDTDGNPMYGILVDNVTDVDGNPVYSNESGVVKGLVAEGSVSLSISNYADIEDTSVTLTFEKGKSYNVNMTVTTRNFLKITSSKSIKFSENVSQVDATLVGGGSGGGNGNILDWGDDTDITKIIGGNGGAGGEVKNLYKIAFSTNLAYNLEIGAGGSSQSNGGNTVAFGNTVNGGVYGQGVSSTVLSSRRHDSATLNGKNGQDGIEGFTSFTDVGLYGAGGGTGGANIGYNTSSVGGVGGNYGGGNGGSSSSSGGVDGGKGTDGFGSGGGGGGITSDRSDTSYEYGGTGGAGGCGCVAIRMHLKTAS